VLVNAVKEQQTQIETQQTQLNQQQMQIEEQQLKQQQTLIEGLKKLLCQQNPTAEVCR
jgi:hypothetical protein